jgi:hypothetical protein
MVLQMPSYHPAKQTQIRFRAHVSTHPCESVSIRGPFKLRGRPLSSLVAARRSPGPERIPTTHKRFRLQNQHSTSNDAFHPNSPCQSGTGKTRNCVLSAPDPFRQDIQSMNSHFQISISVAAIVHTNLCTNLHKSAQRERDFNFAQTKPIYETLATSPGQNCSFAEI